MNTEKLVAKLERFASTLPGLVAELSDEDARWKPADGAWSILEVVCHLADEEVDDFRTRLQMTIEAPGEPWPPIDPEGWARDGHYNERDLASELSRFVEARQMSVSWLRGLDGVDWMQHHEHPKLGLIRAGDLLAAWSAHDWLHCRQIAKRMYQQIQCDAGTFSCAYAGEWKA